MRVCRRKSDGFILEAQNGDLAPLSALLQNAVNSGYNVTNVEVLVLPDSQVNSILSAQSVQARDYADKRRREYPPIGDQLDALLRQFDGQSSLVPELQTIINQWKTVKTKYPKP
jgi:hypothetical protein